jgi:hypothetical protein
MGSIPDKTGVSREFHHMQLYRYHTQRALPTPMDGKLRKNSEHTKLLTCDVTQAITDKPSRSSLRHFSIISGTVHNNCPLSSCFLADFNPETTYSWDSGAVVDDERDRNSRGQFKQTTAPAFA